MSQASSDFRNRVRANKTVWAAGAYDAMSAKMIEAAGFDALLTSGFGVAGFWPAGLAAEPCPAHTLAVANATTAAIANPPCLIESSSQPR